MSRKIPHQNQPEHDESLRPASAWASLKLTPLEDGDVDSLYVWQNEPSIRDLTMGFRFPVQKDAVREWLKNLRERNGKSSVAFAVRHKEELVGVLQLHSIDQYQRKAQLGVYIGDENKRGAGIGYMSCCLMIDYAFNGLGLRRIGLEVVSINSAAIQLYESLGFKKEGCKRKEYFLDGKCLDTFIYGLLETDWKMAIPRSASRLVFSVQ